MILIFQISEISNDRWNITKTDYKPQPPNASFVYPYFIYNI